MDAHTQQSIDNIIELIESKYNVTREQMNVKTKKRAIVQPRQIGWCIIRELLFGRVSLMELGRYFGNRSHCDVCHGVKTINGMRATDKEFSSEYEALKIEARRCIPVIEKKRPVSERLRDLMTYQDVDSMKSEINNILSTIES